MPDPSPTGAALIQSVAEVIATAIVAIVEIVTSPPPEEPPAEPEPPVVDETAAAYYVRTGVIVSAPGGYLPPGHHFDGTGWVP